MSTVAVQSVPVPNFAKLSRNMPTMQLPTFSTPLSTPTLATTPVTPSLAPAPLTVPTLAPTLAPAPAPLSTPTPQASEPVDAPPAFILNLALLDQPKVETLSSQEQQFKVAGFSFKVPRVKAAVASATVDADVTETLDNIEKARPINTPQGLKFTPLDRLSQKDREIIARAQAEYNEHVHSRSTEGVKQHQKELDAWLNMTQKVVGADGKEVEVPVPVVTRILRDVYTMDFKTEDDMRRFIGFPEKKVDGLIKIWSKSHKDILSKLPRSRPDGLRVVYEIPYIETASAQNAAQTVSDVLVASFNQMLATNGSGVSVSYQRVVGEYKTKMVKDKKTGKLVPQDKKRPSEYVVDNVSKTDPWKAAATMVNRLHNRFSDKLHVAVTVFIDYLVRQFSTVAIRKCYEAKKKKIYVKHVFEDVSQIELFPLVSNFKSVKAALANQHAAPAKKLQGKVIGAVNEEEEEKKPTHTKKRPFEYCISAVIDQLAKELDALNPGATFSSFIVSTEYKLFMCDIIDEFIQTLGPILREEITNRDVKTVNVDTFYTVIGSLLLWCRVNFKEVKAYIEERVRRYEQYQEDETPETTQ